METVKISLNYLAPDVSQDLVCKIDLDASDMETLNQTGTLGVKVEETSFLATSEDTLGLPVIETSNELFGLAAAATSEEKFPIIEGSGCVLGVTSEEPIGLDSPAGDMFSLDKEAAILAASEEVSDPTFVTHAFNQKVNLSRKKVKSKEEKLEKKRTLRAKKELENCLKVPVRKTKDNSSETEEVLNSSIKLKRRQLFRDELMDLQCEWKDCRAQKTRMEDFMRHVASHVTEAEVRYNPPPLCDSFGCLWLGCGFETINSQEMVRHINFHAFHTKIKCHGHNMLEVNNQKPCKLDSAQRNVLPDLAGQLRCEWAECERAEEDWDSAQNFYWHVKSHPEDLEEEEGGILQCRWLGCSKKYSTVSKLREHLRCHSHEKLVGCPNCGGLFANRIKFQDHCLKQQDGHSFQCTTCEKKFAIKRHLRDHMRSHVNHYKCPQCEMTCATPSTLKSHITYRHTEDKPFSCEFCDYRGKTMADIKSHVRVHYNEVQHTCPEINCNFTCRAKITIKQHLLTVHQGNSPTYACHVCEEKYFKGSDLTKHLVKEHSFSIPSGHSRFRYTKDSSTGLHRLQTVRFESLHLDENVGIVEAQAGLQTVTDQTKEKKGRKRKKDCQGKAAKKLKTIVMPPLEEVQEDKTVVELDTFDPLLSVKVESIQHTYIIHTLQLDFFKNICFS